MPTFPLKITFRRLRRHKLYSFINIIGLALGIACMLLATLYWKDERSYDNFHQRPALYRITTTLAENKDGVRHTTGGTGQVQGPAFKAGVPEVEDYVRLLGGGISGDVISNNKGLRLKLLFADQSFFRVFSFPLLRGNPATALRDINSVVITESAAGKFFNSTDVIGKEVMLDADPSAKRLGKPMVISGVVKDLPDNSSIQFDLLLPFPFLQLSFEDKAWLSPYLSTFVALRPGADVNAVLQKFNKIHSLYAKEQLAGNIKAFGYDPAISYGLQPITDLHLNPLGTSSENAIVDSSDPVFSWLFLGISIFILSMAGINFINISIAGALQRTKEVGVRKISGGSRRQIILQFLGESAILCLIAFLLALLATVITLPVFNSLTGKHMLFANAIDTGLMVDFILILVAIILFTGVYPAWVLSGTGVKEALYNKQKLSGRNLFGNSLVVLQFSLAVFLLVATLVYYRQMRFIQTKDLGYDTHEVIQTQIPGDREVMPIYRRLSAALAGSPSIKAVSFGGGENVYEVQLQGQSVQAIHRVIDGHYLRVMGIPLKTGRNLSPAFSTDSSQAVIVNEAFVKAARLENPVGTRVKIGEYFDKEQKTIIGVIKDFHTGSLREPIKPMVLFMNSWYGGGILVKLEKSRHKEGMAALESAYRSTIPNAVYQYQFLDEINARQYEQEQRWQKIISVATALAIVICCLGLFGLAHLATRQREKEIGIRKVLGATVSQVVLLLSGGFLKLVLIAIVIAIPAGWFAMNRWLQDFAYRIHPGAGVFVAAGTISIVIALAAVSFQAIKTAVANPVAALRNE